MITEVIQEPSSCDKLKQKIQQKNTINNAIDGLFGNKKEKGEAPDIEQKMFFPTSRKLMLGDTIDVLGTQENITIKCIFSVILEINESKSGKLFRHQ